LRFLAFDIRKCREIDSLFGGAMKMIALERNIFFMIVIN